MASEVEMVEYTLSRLSTVDEMSFTTRRGERLGISGREMTEGVLLRDVRSEAVLLLLVLVVEKVVEIWEVSLAELAVEMARVWVWVRWMGRGGSGGGAAASSSTFSNSLSPPPGCTLGQRITVSNSTGDTGVIASSIACCDASEELLNGFVRLSTLRTRAPLRDHVVVQSMLGVAAIVVLARGLDTVSLAVHHIGVVGLVLLKVGMPGPGQPGASAWLWPLCRRNAGCTFSSSSAAMEELWRMALSELMWGSVMVVG